MVIVRDLSAAAVAKLVRVDLAAVTEEPSSAIPDFDFNGCTCGVASFVGCPPWELHTAGDELLHVLSGETRLTVRRDGAETSRVLQSGALAIVPRDCWHRNEAKGGVTLLFMTPREGNRHSWADPDDHKGSDPS